MSERAISSRLRSPAVWPLVGLFLLVAVNCLHSATFLKITVLDGHLSGIIVDIFNQGSRVALLALGMTLVIATGGIDLSVGSVMAIVGAVAAVMLKQGTLSLAVVLLFAMGVALLCGLANGALVAWARVQPIVATLVLMVAGRGIAQLITDSVNIPIHNAGMEFLSNGFIFGLPFAPVLVSVLYLAVWMVLRRSAGGLFIEATGDNETASRFTGVATARVKCLAYVGCGLCAGVAGLLAASNIRTADPLGAGQDMELDAIFSVIVGGTVLSGGRFSLVGSYCGALMLQTLTTTMYIVGVPSDIAPMPKALLIIVVCLLQSETTRQWIGGLWPTKEVQ